MYPSPAAAAPPFRLPASHRAGVETRLAVVLAVLLLIMTTHSFQFVFADHVSEGLTDRASARGNPLYLGLFAAQAAIAALLLLSALATRRVQSALIVAAAFGGFVTLSAVWSVSAQATLIHATGLLIEIASAYAVATWLEPRRTLRIVFWTFAAILAASFVLLAVAPDLAGELRYGGGWLTDRQFAGVMSSKNYAGYVFACVFVLALHGAAIGLGPLTRLVAGGAALVAIVLSNSATAIMIAVVIALVTMALPLAGLYRRHLLFLALVAATLCVVALPFLDLGSRLGALGRDPTFTGRTDLWAVALDKIAERPVAGFGYYGFFDADPFSPAWDLWSQFLYFLTSSFHNAAVETTVSLGLLGLAAFVAITVRAGAVVLARAVPSDVAIACGLLLGVFVVGSTMELAIMHHNYVATFVTFWCFFVAGRRAGEGR